MAAVFLVSCGGGKSSVKEKEPTVKELAEEKTVHDIDQLIKDLPTPSLVPFTLKSIDAKFSKELINNLVNLNSYKGDTDKMALNMGVYGSDISYLAAYGHEDDCLAYINASHELAEMLGDSTIYDMLYLEKFRGHVKSQNREEISKLLSELFLKTSVQMEEDHHLTMAGLALTGSFVEGLYQAVRTIELYPESTGSGKVLEPLVKVVLDQEKPLNDLISVLRDLPADDTIGNMIVYLSILDQLYKGDLQEIEHKMENDPSFVVTRDMMLDITSEVETIRGLIIK